MRETDVFSALANPTRRQILDLLRQGPRSAGEVAAAFELGRPAVSEHLFVLRQVGLVQEEAVGRQRIYHLNAEGLKAVAEWIHPFERYWRARLRDLRAALDEEHEDD